MNREQIEAWFAIEGWEPLSGVCSDDKTWHVGYAKGDTYVYSYSGEGENPYRFEYLTPEWVEDTLYKSDGKTPAELTEGQLNALMRYVEEKGL